MLKTVVLLNIFMETKIFQEFFDEQKTQRTAFIWNINLL